MQPGWAAEEIREEQIEFEGVKFRVVILEAADVELMWKDSKGTRMRRFGLMQAELARKGRKATFFANGGIFEPKGIPTGMHIEKGKRMLPLNLKDGKGNFYLKPNGVLVWGAPLEKPEIVESEAYARRSVAPTFGLQAGPMLLINRKFHPAFNRGSPNLKHRNGVGVNAKGQLVFAMTGKDQDTTFHKFARLFRDRLGCDNALFLDGDISQMVVNPKGPVESNAFGAVFVVSEKAGG